MSRLRALAALLAASAAAAAPRVGVCFLSRDEGAALAEFLDFYEAQGVEKAYAYVDEASTDDTWEVLKPYSKRGFASAFPWPPRPGSAAAEEILKKGWKNAWEPLERTRYFAEQKGHACKFMRGKPSHCAGHFQASSHCIGRAREEGLDWLGLIDPDEFWFSPHYKSLPTLFERETKRGSVGVGQNAFIYGDGGVSGKCAALPPVTTSHLLRGNTSKVEKWSKFPWVSVGAVALDRVRVHEHEFTGFWCHTRLCRGASFDPWRPPAFKNASCCDRIARMPPVSDLRLNHYQYKSRDCAREKAARNGHPGSELPATKAQLLAEVYDDAVLPFVPPRYQKGAPDRKRGRVFEDFFDGVAPAPRRG